MKTHQSIARIAALALCFALLVNLASLADSPNVRAALAYSPNAGAALAYSPNAGAASSELFISEYVEGSGNNKAIELYNNTGSPIDLAAGGYSIRMYLNGSMTPRTTVNLTGTIDAGGTYVLVDTHADPALLALADQAAPGNWFNGSDAVVLMKGTTMVDEIGIIGQNPSPAWTGGEVSTANQTLVRKPGITEGSTDNQSPYDPSVEWLAYPVDTFSNLGSHNIGVFTVSFDPGAHGAFDPAGPPAIQRVSAGNSAVPPAVTADTGYIFTGWDGSYDAIAADKTITAQYARAVYLVTFQAGGHGTIDPSGPPAVQHILYGESAAAPVVAADEGYRFAGWDQSYSPVTRDLIVTAQYVRASYTVIFDPGDHGMFDPMGAPARQEVLFGNAAFAPTVWADPGYVFVGWDKTFDAVTQDKTVTARYTRNLYKVEFVIGQDAVFKTGGGAREQLILFGEPVLRPADPERAGYAFEGWYADPACTQEFDFRTGIQGPTTVYGKWSPANTGGDPGDDATGNNDGGTEGKTDDAPLTGDPSGSLWFWIFLLLGAGLAGRSIQYRRLHK